MSKPKCKCSVIAGNIVPNPECPVHVEVVAPSRSPANELAEAYAILPDSLRYVRYSCGHIICKRAGATAPGDDGKEQK